MITIKLPFSLPTLNDQINVARSNKYASATMKRKFDRKIFHEIITQIDPIPHYSKISLDVIWIETKKKRDPDNVHSGIKFILDSIVKAGIINNDDRDHVKEILHSIEIEKDRCVIINIIEQ